MVLETTVYTLHTAVAALWVGSVLYASAAILGLAMDGDLDPEGFDSVVARLQWITCGSALVLLATGGHLAGTLYTAESLTGTTRGRLVLVMLALWLLLAAVVEVGSARARRGTAARKIREQARAARAFYLAGSLVAVSLLVVAGLLGSPSAPV